jgi:nitroreductase
MLGEKFLNTLKDAELLIQKRFSCRDFLPTRLSESVKTKLQHYLKSEETEDSFFSIAYSPRYKHDYIIGQVNPSSINSLLFGIRFERIILYCTQLGLSTCWTGVFPQHHFRSLMKNGPQYPIGIISPIGYPAHIPSPKRKKSWEEIFFHRTPQTPLHPRDVPSYFHPLEMVRIGPSGMNLQPWRILYTDHAFHFFLERKNGIVGMGFKTLLLDLQLIDMGIAICHFELSANQRNLKGRWIKDHPSYSIPKEWEYVQTWQIENDNIEQGVMYE